MQRTAEILVDNTEPWDSASEGHEELCAADGIRMYVPSMAGDSCSISTLSSSISIYTTFELTGSNSAGVTKDFILLCSPDPNVERCLAAAILVNILGGTGIGGLLRPACTLRAPEHVATTPRMHSNNNTPTQIPTIVSTDRPSLSSDSNVVLVSTEFAVDSAPFIFAKVKEGATGDDGAAVWHTIPQSSNSFVAPTQFRPPLSGKGKSHFRVRDLC
eukprot:CFRG8150T1